MYLLSEEALKKIDTYAHPMQVAVLPSEHYWIAKH